MSNVQDCGDYGAFIPAQLDDYMLDVYEFRIYCRITRRAGSGKCFESVPNMARACKMTVKRARTALFVLLEAGMVKAFDNGPGKSKDYVRTHHDEWVPSESLEGIRELVTRDRKDDRKRTFIKADTQGGSNPGENEPGVDPPLADPTLLPGVDPTLPTSGSNPTTRCGSNPQRYSLEVTPSKGSTNKVNTPFNSPKGESESVGGKSGAEEIQSHLVHGEALLVYTEPEQQTMQLALDTQHPAGECSAASQNESTQSHNETTETEAIATKKKSRRKKADIRQQVTAEQLKWAEELADEVYADWKAHVFKPSRDTGECIKPDFVRSLLHAITVDEYDRDDIRLGFQLWIEAGKKAQKSGRKLYGVPNSIRAARRSNGAEAKWVGYVEEYREKGQHGGSGSMPSEDVQKQIGAIMRSLNLTAYLPLDWKKRTGKDVVRDLSDREAREYLAELQEMQKKQQVAA